jgi:flagella basal body P-ring formation protein FlgA
LRDAFLGAGSARPDPEGSHLSRRRDPGRNALDVPNIARDGSGPFVDSRSLIVGKAARLTLLPGHAIPFSGVSNRKLVSNGAEVKLVFSEGDLVIMTTGAALQDGSIGDIVRVRNDDSGVTVSGAVQPDGSVRVSGG